jgi:predicted nuclease with RNAse H fold
MRIVGLDLAGVEKRPTGFCMLRGVHAETCLVYTNAEILQKTIEAKPKIVAIDAPLCLPPVRKSIEERTNIYLRDSDRELLHIGIKLFPITLGPMRKLTLRGIYLKSLLAAEDVRVIEAYPGGAQDVLGIPRKQQGIDKLKDGLEKLGIKGLNSQMSHHELDAVTCTYVGKLLLDGKAVIYGSSDVGIVMPEDKRKPK